MKFNSSARFWPVVVTLAFAHSPGLPHPPSPVPAPTGAAALCSDRILIKPKADFDTDALAAFHTAQDSQVLRTWSHLGGIQLLRVPAGATSYSLIQAYQRSGLVEYAEPDWMMQLAGAPNDPSYLDGSLWALNNTGQNAGLADADIDAPEAWNHLTTASNIVVAVVDTGVRYTHEDLAANMWVNPQDGSYGFNAFTGDHDPIDGSGHGSRLAGVIGAVGNNGLGVVGVAWRVQLMACKFAGNQGGSISDAISCIEFARTNGVSIINASWGLYDYSESLSNAIYAARSAGILVVAAAGNDARDTDVIPYYPASLQLDNIVSVTATTRRDELHPLSNIGATNVDLAAPGLDIYSTDAFSDDAYALDEGTSMAAAYVAGVCALLRGCYPAESPPQTIGRLIMSTDRLPVLVGKCVSGGRLNLRKALGLPDSTPPRLVAQLAANNAPLDVLLCGQPHQSYVIETATSIGQWTAAFTNSTGANGTFVFTDDSWPVFTQRFYRARLSR